MKSKVQKQEEAKTRDRAYRQLKKDHPEIVTERPCNNCKFHTNHPSFCTDKGLYVGRRETCMDWSQ